MEIRETYEVVELHDSILHGVLAFDVELEVDLLLAEGLALLEGGGGLLGDGLLGSNDHFDTLE